MGTIIKIWRWLSHFDTLFGIPNWRWGAGSALIMSTLASFYDKFGAASVFMAVLIGFCLPYVFLLLRHEWRQRKNQMEPDEGTENKLLQAPQYGNFIALAGATEDGTWTPEFTFSHAGDLSVEDYGSRARYWKLGTLIELEAWLAVSLKFSTASGQSKITGLPFVGPAHANWFDAEFEVVGSTGPPELFKGRFDSSSASLTILALADNLNSGSIYRIHFRMSYREDA